MAVKLDEAIEDENAKILHNSLVAKIFGKDIPPHIVAWELRRQWAQYGQFHFTSLGMGWFLCSFKREEAFEEIISGGPWFVNGHIVGMEKWTPGFSPSSLKGLTSPVWIRLPQLPLQCWDKVNVARIASMVGVPMMLDGNMFQWGRREFARICVRVKLDKPLPLGVWVDSMAGRFFQNVEYEKISSFCFDCGMIGHVKMECKKSKPLLKDQVTEGTKDKVDIQGMKGMNRNSTYRPWILVNYNKNNRGYRGTSNKFPAQRITSKQRMDNVNTKEADNSVGMAGKVLEDSMKVNTVEVI
ncbi:uncharacterized protein LOC110115708 [Dendrobium catenatum]|uniref:uncharacterized protein LOC110115708 n=1 Tax=Dendrobium catenatum TaxID=906689 RepID=UPI0009F50437|nr:uncharacterized protein LOC110115708 [Dendrobium catenatum]